MSPRTLTGRAVLELMADGERRFAREIAAGIGTMNETASGMARRLFERGLLIRTVADGIAIYQMTDAGWGFLASNQPLCGPGKGNCAKRNRLSLRARAWNLMRMREWWTVGDLLMTVADGSEAGADANMRRYVRALERTGYLIESKREKKRWHLSKDTGRLAPALNTAEGTLTDPNTGEVHCVRW